MRYKSINFTTLLLGITLLWQQAGWACSYSVYSLRPMASREKGISITRFANNDYAVTTIDELRDAVSAIIEEKTRRGFIFPRNSEQSVKALARIRGYIRVKGDFFEAQDLVFEWANKFLYDYRYDAAVIRAVEAITWRKLPSPIFRELLYNIGRDSSLINNPNAFAETPLAIYERIWAQQYEETFREFDLSLSQMINGNLEQLKKDYTPRYLNREVQKVEDALKELDARRKRILTRLHEAVSAGRHNTKRIKELEEDLRVIDNDIDAMRKRLTSLMQVKNARAILEAQYEVNEIWKTLSPRTKARIAELKRTKSPTWQLLFDSIYSPSRRDKTQTINFILGELRHPQAGILSAV